MRLFKLFYLFFLVLVLSANYSVFSSDNVKSDESFSSDHVYDEESDREEDSSSDAGAFGLSEEEPIFNESSKEVEDLVVQNRKDHGVALLGIAPSNIRRQLLRCRELFLIEKVKTTYRITENGFFSEIFKEKIEHYFLNSILDRTREYMARIDEEFLK